MLQAAQNKKEELLRVAADGFGDARPGAGEATNEEQQRIQVEEVEHVHVGECEIIQTRGVEAEELHSRLDQRPPGVDALQPSGSTAPAQGEAGIRVSKPIGLTLTPLRVATGEAGAGAEVALAHVAGTDVTPAAPPDAGCADVALALPQASVLPVASKPLVARATDVDQDAGNQLADADGDRGDQRARLQASTPSAWHVQMSPTECRPYWHHKDTNTVSWTIPHDNAHSAQAGAEHLILTPLQEVIFVVVEVVVVVEEEEEEEKEKKWLSNTRISNLLGQLQRLDSSPQLEKFLTSLSSTDRARIDKALTSQQVGKSPASPGYAASVSTVRTATRTREVCEEPSASDDASITSHTRSSSLQQAIASIRSQSSTLGAAATQCDLCLSAFDLACDTATRQEEAELGIGGEEQGMVSVASETQGPWRQYATLRSRTPYWFLISLCLLAPNVLVS
jgi:hypothetical protein